MLDGVKGVESIVNEVPMAASLSTTHDADGRPIRLLPTGHLIRISLYWLGISTVWSGILDIVNGRIQFTNLVPKGEEGLGAFQIALAGTFIGLAVAQGQGGTCG